MPLQQRASQPPQHLYCMHNRQGHLLHLVCGDVAVAVQVIRPEGHCTSAHSCHNCHTTAASSMNADSQVKALCRVSALCNISPDPKQWCTHTQETLNLKKVRTLEAVLRQGGQPAEGAHRRQELLVQQQADSILVVQLEQALCGLQIAILSAVCMHFTSYRSADARSNTAPLTMGHL